MKLIEQLLSAENIISLVQLCIALYFIFKLDIATDTLKSLNVKEEGYSGRKMAAVSFTMLVAYLHYMGFTTSNKVGELSETIINSSNVTTIILIDVAVVLLSLALVRFTDIIKFKNGDKV